MYAETLNSSWFITFVGVSRSEPHTSETTKESGHGLYHTQYGTVRTSYSRKDPFLILRVSKLRKATSTVPVPADSEPSLAFPGKD